MYCIELYVIDTAREIVKKFSPSPRIAAPRARTRKAELQRASRRLQTNGVWRKRTTSKTGRRRQPPSALHRERNATQRNKLHPKAATTKMKRGLPCMWRALYVTSLVCGESCMWRVLYVTSLVCSEPFSNSKSREKWVQCQMCKKWVHEQCTSGYTAVHTRLHEQCTPGYTSSAHQATRAVHIRLHEQCTPGYNRSICPNCESGED